MELRLLQECITTDRLHPDAIHYFPLPLKYAWKYFSLVIIVNLFFISFQLLRLQIRVFFCALVNPLFPGCLADVLPNLLVAGGCAGAGFLVNRNSDAAM